MQEKKVCIREYVYFQVELVSYDTVKANPQTKLNHIQIVLCVQFTSCVYWVNKRMNLASSFIKSIIYDKFL